MLEADAGKERIGVAMRQSPLGPIAQVDQGHPQRPILGWQASYFDMGACSMAASTTMSSDA